MAKTSTEMRKSGGLTLILLVHVVFCDPILSNDLATNSEPMNHFYYLSGEDQKKLEEQSKNGDGTAAFRLARYFEFYISDINNALPWLRRAEELGHVEAALPLAYYYCHSVQPPCYKTAFEVYQKWAKRGNADAMIAVGEMLEGGQGIPKDRAEAMKWYEKAARAGKVFTMEKLSSKLLEDGNVFEAYIWAEVGSLRRKRVGPEKIKQRDLAELAKRLSAEQLEQSKERAAKLDKEIPFIEPWMSW